MNIIKNKKGFTLIELLAVIVILAILILIAASNIGAVTTRAKKNVVAIEGNTLVDAAKNAYQIGLMDGSFHASEVSQDSEKKGVCFTMSYLCKNGYYSKGCLEDGQTVSKDGYSGSVLIQTTDAQGEIFKYTLWISDGNYAIENKEVGVTGSDASAKSSADSNCGNLGKVVTGNS